MKTFSARESDIERKWWLVDASDRPIGRVASQVARILKGKNKPEYTAHVDTGDFVVIVNSDKTKLSGNKWNTKTYYRHLRYIGHLKETSAQDMKEKHPERMIQHAIRGMLPKNSLGRKMLKKLKVYVGGEHPHKAQKPEPYNLI